MGGAKLPTLLCKFSKAGRRDDPCKLHFESEKERAGWRDALCRARDEAQRA